MRSCQSDVCLDKLLKFQNTKVFYSFLRNQVRGQTGRIVKEKDHPPHHKSLAAYGRLSNSWHSLAWKHKSQHVLLIATPKRPTHKNIQHTLDAPTSIHSTPNPSKHLQHHPKLHRTNSCIAPTVKPPAAPRINPILMDMLLGLNLLQFCDSLIYNPWQKYRRLVPEPE